MPKYCPGAPGSDSLARRGRSPHHLAKHVMIGVEMCYAVVPHGDSFPGPLLEQHPRYSLQSMGAYGFGRVLRR